jgi:von Willebrand factor type A C-terminal domain/von Willebrand factor type A domain
MSQQPDFSIKVDQNRYLPEGGREVNAIVTVEATGVPLAGSARATAAAVVVIIDTSGSMTTPGNKMAAARKAAQAAVDGLRDGVDFAVVSGSSWAKMIYPAGEQLVAATPQSRSAAKTAIGRLSAAGGTAIGSWLRLADRLFAHAATAHPSGIRHAILLTDGKNQHETAQELDATLAACAGHFVCDCRGVGTDWEVAELRKVSSTLLGSVDIVAQPKDLEADFLAMTRSAMGKAIADVALRVWTPRDARLRFVKQVLPSLADLTAKRTDAGPQAGDYPTGAWGEESRDYHICVEVPVGEVGREMRAGWVKLVLPGATREQDQVLATGNILAEWTDDAALSTRINPRVAHYTGQAELAEVIQEGLRARKDGDLDTATARLGRAVALAEESGNEAIAALLGKVVDVVDPATGTVRLKKHIDKADEMSLDTRSSKTVRTRVGPGDPPRASQAED